MKNRFKTTDSVDSSFSEWRDAPACCNNRSQRGLTLLEMMVAMALLTVIVLGLTGMFLQTQKAFKSGLKQVDVFEGGRSAIAMMTRDFEQMSDANSTNIVDFSAALNTDVPPLYQRETDFTRTNQLQSVYALIQNKTTWYGIDYFVIPQFTNVGVGTLYRNSASTKGILRDNILYWKAWTNYNRVADGVVHFKVRAFDTNGLEVLPLPTPATPVTFPNPTNGIFAGLPSYLEIELGVLEPETLEQVRSLGNNVTAITNFLSSRMSKVHIFRQQVPIRTAVPR